MGEQLEMWGTSRLGVEVPDGAREPRLWVRRLVLWAEPCEVIRQVDLRPGLNIIWSPDPTSEGRTEGGLGHGGGKTLFCRLIRYCLGEERFGSPAQRDSVASRLRDGLVGAEVVVEGEPWAIVRPLGMRRRRVAVRGGDLDALAADLPEHTGMDPFIEEVTGRFVQKELAALVHPQKPELAWLVALAWLTRDQECRLADIVSWRDRVMDSGSPTRHMSKQQRQTALRAFLRLIDVEERRVQLRVTEAKRRGNRARHTAERAAWAGDRLRQHLVAELDLKDAPLHGGDLDLETFRQAILANLAPEASEVPPAPTARLREMRDRLEKAEGEVRELERDCATASSAREAVERSLANLRDLRGIRKMDLKIAKTPVCPVCVVPIDQALAEGCKISLADHDAQGARARWEGLNKKIESEEATLKALKEREREASRKLPAVRERRDRLREQVSSMDRALEERTKVWARGRSLLDQVERLRTLEEERRGAEESQRKSSGKGDELGKTLESHRQQQNEALTRLAGLYESAVSELAGERVKGHIALKKEGLTLGIRAGGDLVTGAINSLKVLAFDIAALCLSVEGRTHVPAFLVHDSPREADLGLSIYQRLFYVVRSLHQDIGPDPLFQYILTTTTAPPNDMQSEDWVRLKLRGEPEEKRLLQRDL